jgi:hypothetical protein
MSVAEQIASLLRLGPRREDERRHLGRARTERLHSDAGAVVDLSRDGAKIICRKPWPRNERRKVNLMTPTIGLTLEARCTWEKSEGRRRHVVGVRFENMTDGLRAVVAEMMRSAAPANSETWNRTHNEVVQAIEGSSWAAPSGARPILGEPMPGPGPMPATAPDNTPAPTPTRAADKHHP